MSLIALNGIGKAYPGVRAIERADFRVEAGSIVGLVGKNGAGKSTLIRVMAGAAQPDAGTVEVDGEATTIASPRAAHELGFGFVFQELVDVPGMTVAENVALAHGFPKRPWRQLNRRALQRQVAEVLQRLHISLSPAAFVDDLTVVERRMVMIAAVLYRRSRMVVLDEPTASLGAEEVARVHDAIATLREHGVAIVYVSHRLEEVFAICDRVTVMRDGVTVADAAIADIDRPQLLRWITGDPDAARHEHTRIASGWTGEREAILEVTDLQQAGVIAPTSFTLHRGEVLGLGGLVGAGRTELARLIAGSARPTGGTVRVGGRAVRARTPADALAHGIAMLPEDRKNEGIFAAAGIRENMTLSALRNVRRWKPLPVPARSSEIAEVLEVMDTLRIEADDVEKDVGLLSGGNQQKVVLGRWLLHGADVLIFDEPTHGVDVEAKEEIFRLIATLAGAGRGIVMISSELRELERVCDRVLVMREGRPVEMLDGQDITENRILAACYGESGG